MGESIDRSLSDPGQPCPSREEEELEARLQTERAERRWVRRFYVRHVLPRIADPLVRQRLKMLYFGWAYWRLLFETGMPLGSRLRLLRRFARIDWNVLHCHFPSETVRIAAALADRPARSGECMAEAGCWNGGSSAKFSLLCAELGYRLHIYDSFEGVERLSGEEEAREWDFAGQYASPESRLRENLSRFGAPEVCTIHPGWFSDTLAREPVPGTLRVGYIDCDLGKGTVEALRGMIPVLANDGCVFSQDYHIAPVRRVLHDPETWRSLDLAIPTIERLGTYLAKIRPATPR